MGSNLILRIDDRLVHGQVITGWVKSLNLNNIIVANNKLVRDKYKIEAIKIAIPVEINIEFLTIVQAVKSFKENKWDKYQTIILVESPKDAYELITRGFKIDTINVGGLHYKDNRIQITENLALNDEDIEYLFKISNLGIKLEGRALPTDEDYDVIEAIKNYNKKNGNNKI